MILFNFYLSSWSMFFSAIILFICLILKCMQIIQRSCFANVVICLQANRKTRNRAYDLLVEIGHACGDEEQGGKKENLLNFFHMVIPIR